MILYTLYFILFLFGLSAGSFLNAIIWRLEKGKSIIMDFFRCHPDPSRAGRRISSRFFSPRCRYGEAGGLCPQNDKEEMASARLSRSCCPKCEHILKWYDLIPVLSFIFLRGKCRYCGKNISWQYPIVEMATALIFLLIFNKIFNFKFFLISNAIGNYSEAIGIFEEVSSFKFQVLSLIFWLYIASVLIVIFVYDLKHYIIPDKVLFPAIIITFLFRIYEFLVLLLSRHAELISASPETLKQVQGDKLWMIGSWPLVVGNLRPYFLSAIIASVFFLSLVLMSRGRAMGMGDAKLALLMGLVLGWPNILAALFFSFLSGAIIGLGLILASNGNQVAKSRKLNYSPKSQIPFGPFLVAGTFFALFWGNAIINYYSSLFL